MSYLGKVFNRIYDISRKYIKLIIITSLLAILINIGEIIRPKIIESVIDDFLSKNIFDNGKITVFTLGYIYIGIVVFQYLLDFIVSALTGIIGDNIVYEMRNKLFRFSQKANISFHDKTSSGKLYVRIINDAEDILYLFTDVFSTFLKDIVLIIAILGVMIYMSLKLSLMVFAIFPFLIVIIMIFMKILNKIYDKSKVIRTNLNSFLAESIYGIKLIKIFNIQQEKLEECKNYTKEFKKTKFPASIIYALIPGVMIVIENIGIAIVFCACMNNIFGIKLEIGIMYVFITYLKSLFSPIERIIENVEVLEDAVTSINKIYEILDQEESIEDFEEGNKLENVKGKIEFKNVWFAYEKENWILKDISFVINPGETIALVGKTGSGKTTITNLINRFYDIQKGEILLDGVNIKDINKKDLRTRIGTILQDPFIFAKSIKDNIKLNKDISDEKINEAVKNASAEEFINSLPNGLEEISKERGDSYSVGQKQLLAFSRIFALNPDIFILDEATANIDTYTESLIQKSIDTLSAQKTAIFIAHRLSTIVNVDKIIVLNQGKIVEQGNHKELVNTGGYYSKLYNAYYESLG